MIILALCLIIGLSYKANAQTGCEPVWQQLLMHNCLGAVGMEAADYDDDGNTELIMASTEYWYVMEYLPEKADYEVVWLSKHYHGLYDGELGNISILKLMDVDDDDEPEILVGTLLGNIDVYDLKTLTLKTTFKVPDLYQAIWVLLKSDCDNDGQEELVLGSRYNVFIYNITEGQFEYQQQIAIEDPGVACGDTDGDGIVSMAFAHGTMVTIQNGIVSEPEAYCTSCFGDFIDMLDVDADGKDEIIMAGVKTRVIDADTKEEKWLKTNISGCNTLYFNDVNDDGKAEMLWGGSFGSLNCVDALTGTLLWEIPNPEGFGEILITDCDSDDKKEVLMSTQCVPGGHLYIHDLETKLPEWSNHLIYGPVCGIDAKDVDGDGQPEIVTLSKNGTLYFHDAATRELKWQSTSGQIPGEFSDIPLMKVFDIDNDGINEIIISAGGISNPTMIVFNGADKTIESQKTWDSGSNIDLLRSLQIIDTDGNGTYEYVCGDDEFAYIINPTDYSIIWRSASLYRQNETMAADIDNDNEIEIISAADKLTIFDPPAYIKQFEFYDLYNESFTCLEAKDLDSDGNPELISGTMHGPVFIFNLAELDTTWINTGVEERICAIRAGDFVDVPGNEFVFTTNDGNLNFLLSDKTLYQREADFKFYLGRALQVTDYNNDSENEIFLGTMVNAVEYSPDCFICAGFSALANIISADITGTQNCEGSVRFDLSGGVMPYRYKIGTNTFTLVNNEIAGLCSGLHTITLLDANNCEISVDVVIEEALSTPELSSEAGFSIYPVPGAGNLTIQFNEPVSPNTRAEIRSIQGVLLITTPLNQTRSTIDAGKLSSGVYFITITDGKKLSTAKVVIKN